jgi:uncharacterized membrane protein YccC
MMENGMRSKICLWAILLSLLPILSYAQNQNTSQVQELYVRSGMQKQLEQLPSLVQTMFNRSVQEDEQGRKLPKALLSAMSAAAPVAFAPKKLQGTILAELTEKLKAQDIKEVLKWLDSPFGKKCTGLEEESFTPQAQADMERYAAGLQASPPTAERLKVLREFDSAVKATDGAVDAAIATQVALALAIIATFPPEQQMPLDAISREMEKNRPVLEAEVRSQVLISNLYTYRSLTEAEIKLYTEFAKSPAGSRYHSVSMVAFKKAILEGAVKWGELIGNAIKQSKGNSEA